MYKRECLWRHLGYSPRRVMVPPKTSEDNMVGPTARLQRDHHSWETRPSSYYGLSFGDFVTVRRQTET